MIKQLRKLYQRVGGERFEKGVYGFLRVIAFAFLFALFANILQGCGADKDKLKFEVCEVKTSGVMYQTSESNKRLKEPVETETVFLVVGGGK